MARRRKNPYPKIPGFETGADAKDTLLLAAGIGSAVYTALHKKDWMVVTTAVVTLPMLGVIDARVRRGGGESLGVPLSVYAAAPYVIGPIAAYLAYDYFSRAQNTALSGPSVQQGLLIGPHTPSF